MKLDVIEAVVLETGRFRLTWPGELDVCPNAMRQHIAASGEWVME